MIQRLNDVMSMASFIENETDITWDEDILQAISKNFEYLHHILDDTPDMIYGINTGFGSLCNIRIDEEELVELQRNLVISHACGTGDLVPKEICQWILLLKIKNFSLAHSAVSTELFSFLTNLYNQKVFPVIYQLGSLGASGDLAPLAHLSLPILGEGEVYYNGMISSSKEVLSKIGMSALSLQAKEGLALLNGTQFSQAYGCWSLVKAHKLLRLAIMISAASVEGFHCNMAPFNVLLHQVRPHPGQQFVAHQILNLLEGSDLPDIDKSSVQDPYAFRCIPQVLGASIDAFLYAKQVFDREVNSVTDNPTVFDKADLILSGGNFHAQPLALAMDFLAIALAEVGNISERRLYQLISGQRGLPVYLSHNPGKESGVMILQYTAASIVSQNKQLCTPASVDSIVSCNGQEDHVSMASNAGTKLYRLVQNLERVLAIECIAASQALSFRSHAISPSLQPFIEEFRKSVPLIEKDRILHNDIEQAIQFLQDVDLSNFQISSIDHGLDLK